MLIEKAEYNINLITIWLLIRQDAIVIINKASQVFKRSFSLRIILINTTTDVIRIVPLKSNSTIFLYTYLVT